MSFILRFMLRMPEVQKHGFSWEKDLIHNVYGATEEELKAIHYTDKMDLPSHLNKKEAVDVSLKTTCSANTICMADCLRVYDSVSSGKPLHMTSILYKQNDEIKSLVSVTEVDLTGSVALLFGSLTRSDIESLDRIVKQVPQKRSPTNEEHERMFALQKELQAKSGAIYLNIKCNSQQSRLQCSFNSFQKFLKDYPERVVAHSTTDEFRGGKILTEIKSPRRSFRKSNTQ